MRLIKLWGVLILWSATWPLGAQVLPQISEEDVNRQKLLIEANREKLLGNYDQAITLLQELHKKENDNAAAIAYELSRLYKANGDIETAIRYGKQAFDLNPSNEWFAKSLADFYQENGRNREGAALYTELIKQQPDSDYNYYKLAYFLVRDQEIDKAIKVYDQLEERFGFSEELARRKHTLYMGKGDAKKAARELERLIDAYPTTVEYYHLLAGFYEANKQSNEARSVYQAILKIDPTDAKAQLAIAGNTDAVRDEWRYLSSLRPAFERYELDIDAKIGKLLALISKVADTRDVVLADSILQLAFILQKVHPQEAKSYAVAGDLY